jgi:osmoprotectant transport system ATP-binding protein
MTAPLIALNRVSKSFDGGRSFAVSDVSLAIAERSFVALIGGSGSGKTTTCKFINRLIDPDRGDVFVDGRAAASMPLVALRRGIGYVFQGIGLFPHMSVAENIGITPELDGWPRAEIAARTAELLDLVGLPQDYAFRFPDALSGGQRQRVGVARALAARPRIVLIDEPFGALDPLTRDALGNAYRDLHDRLGLTTVMVTHDVQEAVLLSDRIVVLKAGRVVADGAPGALMAGHDDPEVAAIMGMPARQAERIERILHERSHG